jgi:GT2 family glycosyltransferase
VLFSFVIPFRDNHAQLFQTLAALNRLEGFGKNDYEVIVVDDGSLEEKKIRTGDLNTGYPIEYLYLPRDPRSSRSRARNHGWRIARGEIIVFIDSDIIVRSDYLKEVGRCFQSRRDILVVGPRILLGRDETEKITSGSVSAESFRLDPDDYESRDYRQYLCETISWNVHSHAFPWTLVYSCNMAVRKSDLETVNGFDENFIAWGLEDNELGLSLMESGVLILLNPRMEVLHQYHGCRNDHFIPDERKDEYEKNILYLLDKHPGALGLPRRHAMRFLRGDIKPFDTASRFPSETIEFRNAGDLAGIKDRIVKTMETRDRIIAVNDYLETTDLDLWIQGFGKKGSMIKYFPASARFNAGGMREMLDGKKNIKRGAGL